MKRLLIIFVKNAKPGKVKTRLAKVIGNDNALKVYNELIQITQKVVSNIDVDTVVYYSDYVEHFSWPNQQKKVQQGEDLGVRMRNAFSEGFNLGHESIVLIGSDLPDIAEEIILSAFQHLEEKNAVFGPAQDGGYYLIGLTTMLDNVFENKPWSEPNLLKETLTELEQNNYSYSLLGILNDIDTYDDLIKSSFYQNFSSLIGKY